MYEIYQETIPFPLVKVILGVLTVFTLLMLFFLVYQLTIGPVGNRPAPDWFYLVMFLFLSGITAFVTNFNKLSIKMTAQSITVGFGIMKKSISWDNIEGCYLDEAPGLSYGGWGIRLARIKGRWRSVYNVIGHPVIVLELSTGKFREFAFSTNNPQEVLEIVRQKIWR